VLSSTFAITVNGFDSPSIGKEKSENCGGDDGRGEPEVGAELSRAREKEKEGGVHELVRCCGRRGRMYFNLRDVPNSIRARPKSRMLRSRAPVDLAQK